MIWFYPKTIAAKILYFFPGSKKSISSHQQLIAALCYDQTSVKTTSSVKQPLVSLDKVKNIPKDVAYDRIRLKLFETTDYIIFLFSILWKIGQLKLLEQVQANYMI